MKIEIKNRYNGSVIFSHECENNTIKLTVEFAIKSKINLSGANLFWADLSGANLFWADLSRANLSGADLSGADLSGANLFGADLSGANLFGADLSGANLSGANLSRANMSGADLSGANLSVANLSVADLSGANLSRANLSGANLSGANLSGANLKYSIGNIFEIKSMQLQKWKIAFTKEILAIGCKQYTIEEWRNFSDEQINCMDIFALEFWKKWKDFIFQAIDLSFGE